VARYAGAPETAVLTFRAAGGALPPASPGRRTPFFSLGRLAFEGGAAERAAGWFARYVQRWPEDRWPSRRPPG
jgi:hypothetical protein